MHLVIFFFLHSPTILIHNFCNPDTFFSYRNLTAFRKEVIIALCKKHILRPNNVSTKYNFCGFLKPLQIKSHLILYTLFSSKLLEEQPLSDNHK